MQGREEELLWEGDGSRKSDPEALHTLFCQDFDSGFAWRKMRRVPALRSLTTTVSVLLETNIFLKRLKEKKLVAETSRLAPVQKVKKAV